MSTKLLQFARWSAFAVLLCLWQPCFGQFNSSVEGTVSDPSGAVVPNALVTLHNAQNGIDLTDQTQGSGFYRFSGVGPGDYVITIDAKGFAKKSTSVHVQQDQIASVNVSLGLSGATAVVNVTGVADQLNPDETRVATTLESDQIENLPLQNGSVLEVVRTAPGVTGIDETRSMSAVSINGNTMYAQADGRPNGGSSYQLDGVSIQNNTDYASNVTGNHNIEFMPSEDMVQEVALEVNNYDVDWGSGSSMKVNITTKGGTDKFHGSIGYRNNSRGLNSTPDFTSPASPNSTKWWTGSVGGPIWKDKTFFFVAYQHQTETNSVPGLINYADNGFTGTWATANYPEPANNLTTSAPSQGADVANLYSAFPTFGAGVPQSADVVAGQVASIAQLSVLQHASDLFSTDVPDVCAVPIKDGPWFFGKQIASTPIPCSQAIVDQGEYSQAPRVDGFLWNGRLDQTFRQGKDRLYADYVLLPQISDFIWWRPGFNCETPGGSRYLNFNFTHIVNDHLIAQTAANYLRFYNSFTADPANTIPFLSLMLGGFGSEGATDWFGTPADPAWQKTETYQVHEDVTYTKGRHTIKGGFSFARGNSFDNNEGSSAKGQTPIFWSFSDVLDDMPYSYGLDTLSAKTGQFVKNITGDVVNEVGIYGEDSWKVRPNLLVTLGIRWDSYGNPTPWGQNALPFINMVSPAGSTLRQNIASDNISTMQVSNALAHAQDRNFLPRVGFAWTPNDKRVHKVSVHGGIGIYEDAIDVGGIIGGLTSNSPSLLNESFGFTNPAPLNNVDVRNYYGVTTWTGAPPWGQTYTHPAIVPSGVDSHGEVIIPSGDGTAVVTTNLGAVDPSISPQKTALYNLQIEKELSGNFIFAVGYSGSLSWGEYASGDYNSYPGDEIANNGAEKRLSPEWGSISEYANLQRGNYNALILSARQNYHRISWHANYQYAKTLSSAGQTIGDIYDPNHYYGPANGSVPFSFNGSISYELPGKELHNFVARTLLAGWTVSGVTTAQSGQPFQLETTTGFVPQSAALPSQGGTCTTVNCGTDISNPSNAGTYLANGVSNSLVNIPAGIKKKNYSRSQWKAGAFSNYGYTYNSHPSYAPGQSAAAQGAAFTNPSAYAVSPVYSNQGANSFYGPGYLGVDGALHKKVYLPWFGKEGGSTLTMGLEGSNIINRVNLEQPGAQSTSATNLADPSDLGVIYTANQGRYFQVMGRFTF
jgi:hypothetical protein